MHMLTHVYKFICTHPHTHTNVHMDIYIYIYIYIIVDSSEIIRQKIFH